MIRHHAQSRTTDEARRYPLRDLARAMEHPWTVAVGEVTRWPDAYAGAPDLLRRLAVGQRRGRRVQGHTAGASGEKIAALTAAGFTSDHEPITAGQGPEPAPQGIAVKPRRSPTAPAPARLLDP